MGEEATNARMIGVTSRDDAMIPIGLRSHINGILGETGTIAINVLPHSRIGNRHFVRAHPYEKAVLFMEVFHAMRKGALLQRSNIGNPRDCPQLRTWEARQRIEAKIICSVCGKILQIMEVNSPSCNSHRPRVISAYRNSQAQADLNS